MSSIPLHAMATTDTPLTRGQARPDQQHPPHGGVPCCSFCQGIGDYHSGECATNKVREAGGLHRAQEEAQREEQGDADQASRPSRPGAATASPACARSSARSSRRTRWSRSLGRSAGALYKSLVRRHEQKKALNRGGRGREGGYGHFIVGEVARGLSLFGGASSEARCCNCTVAS